LCAGGLMATTQKVAGDDCGLPSRVSGRI